MRHKKAIAVFTGGGLFADLILKELVPFIDHMGYSLILFDTARSSVKKKSNPYLERFAFFEKTLLNDVIRPAVNQSGFNRSIYSSDSWKQAFDFEHHHQIDVNTPSFVDQISSDNRIIGGISIRNFQIFKKSMIDCFRSKGFLWNAHPGHLPNYQGVFSSFRAMTSGDHRMSWTLHQMDEGIDTGQVISSISQGADIESDFFLNFALSCPNISFLIKSALNDYLVKGRVYTYEQDKNRQTYFSYPTYEECKSWSKQGYHLIRSPMSVINFYRDYVGSLELNQKGPLFENMISYVRTQFNGGEDTIHFDQKNQRQVFA